MTALPNPFLNSTVIQPPTVEEPAAAPAPGKGDAAAAPYRYLGNFAACEPWAAQGMFCDDCMMEWTGCWDNFQCPKCGKGELPNCNLPDLIDEPSMTMEVPSEASAPAPTKNPDADALGTEFIHEIFFYARRLMANYPGFVLDEARFIADIEELPMFLREDGYLKRQA